MSKENIELITPPGILVWGDVHKAQPKTDRNGQPKLRGDGTQLAMFDFGVAIPKTAAAWKDEPGYGQTIHAAGVRLWPTGQHAWPAFAWKITDGDSAVPNKKGIAPNTREGYPGHWILAFSGMYAPQLMDATGGAVVSTTRTDIMLPGDWVQVIGTISSNESADSPGIYLNHNGVCFKGLSARGRITARQAIDPSKFAVGLAAGATLTPAANPGTPGATPPVPAPATAPVAPAPVAPPPVPQQTAVTPSATFVPQPPAAVAPAPIAPPPAVRQVFKDGAVAGTLEQFVSAGWSEATLAQNGYVVQ